jgi:diguanylate cyclase (GGDEF)-like protein
MRIVIIDDSKNGSTLLKAILQKAGFVDIFTATGLNPALELLNAKETDLILLSYVLPEISGPEACQQISSNLLYEDIPIIMVTANNDIETLQHSFENGAIDYIAKPFNGQELIARVQAHLIRKHVSDKRKQIAITDPLTNIYNRRHFDAIYDLFYTRALSENKNISFFMLDIDNFKKYNDHYGHQKGDEALAAVAATLQKQLHRTDDYLFRLGGEEFAILLYDTPLNFLEVLSGKIHYAISLLGIEHKDNEAYGKLTISIGVTTAQCREDITKFNIYNSADKALYASKEKGRNTTTFYSLL